MRRILAPIECGCTLAEVTDRAGLQPDTVLLGGLFVLAIVLTAVVWGCLCTAANALEHEERLLRQRRDESDDCPFFHV